MTVREYLKENTLIFDGSMGTYFASKYDSALDKCELANIKNEKLVYDIHKEYIEAGCNAIKTNTFGANLPEMDFDEELFNQQLAYATVPADNEIVFHFRDGHEASRIFVQKRQMPRQTEERKKHMSEVIKAKWRERHAKND